MAVVPLRQGLELREKRWNRTIHPLLSLALLSVELEELWHRRVLVPLGREAEQELAVKLDQVILLKYLTNPPPSPATPQRTSVPPMRPSPALFRLLLLLLVLLPLPHVAVGDVGLEVEGVEGKRGG
jgi:hypothetical protein